MRAGVAATAAFMACICTSSLVRLGTRYAERATPSRRQRVVDRGLLTNGLGVSSTED